MSSLDLTPQHQTLILHTRCDKKRRLNPSAQQEDNDCRHELRKHLTTPGLADVAGNSFMNHEISRTLQLSAKGDNKLCKERTKARSVKLHVNWWRYYDQLTCVMLQWRHRYQRLPEICSLNKTRDENKYSPCRSFLEGNNIISCQWIASATWSTCPCNILFQLTFVVITNAT